MDGWIGIACQARHPSSACSEISETVDCTRCASGEQRRRRRGEANKHRREARESIFDYFFLAQRLAEKRRTRRRGAHDMLTKLPQKEDVTLPQHCDAVTPIKMIWSKQSPPHLHQLSMETSLTGTSVPPW